MNYTFDDADAAERHATQYFEMLGNRAIYHKGWTAVAKHKDPWLGSDHGLDDDVWELYNIEEDWTQSNDLAAEEPERLAHLQRLFLIQAARFNVLPHGHPLGRADQPRHRRPPALLTGTTQTFYPGMRRLSENTTINIKNKSYTVTAAVEVPDGGADGVIIAQGGAYGGWSVYAHDGKLALRLQPARHRDRPSSPRTPRCRPESRSCGPTSPTTAGGSARAARSRLRRRRADRRGPRRAHHPVPVLVRRDRRRRAAISPRRCRRDYGATGNAFTGTIDWVRIDLGDDDHSHLDRPRAPDAGRDDAPVSVASLSTLAADGRALSERVEWSLLATHHAMWPGGYNAYRRSTRRCRSLA